MKVFISWSGTESRYVADVLHRWLKDVIHVVDPWVSTKDIRAGGRWLRDVQKELEDTKFGIICLTKENQVAPWILFEAGALGKAVEESFVCPFLIGMSPSEIAQGPLSQFQAKRADEQGTWELVVSVNGALDEKDRIPEEDLRRYFGKWWPDFDARVKERPVELEDARPHRSLEQKVDEILDVVRGLTRGRVSVDDLFDEVMAKETLARVNSTGRTFTLAQLREALGIVTIDGIDGEK